MGAKKKDELRHVMGEITLVSAFPPYWYPKHGCYEYVMGKSAEAERSVGAGLTGSRHWLHSDDISTQTATSDGGRTAYGLPAAGALKHESGEVAGRVTR